MASTLGIDEERLAQLNLALNEIMTNAVIHGEGRARLRVWILDSWSAHLFGCGMTQQCPVVPTEVGRRPHGQQGARASTHFLEEGADPVKHGIVEPCQRRSSTAWLK